MNPISLFRVGLACVRFPDATARKYTFSCPGVAKVFNVRSAAERDGGIAEGRIQVLPDVYLVHGRIATLSIRYI